MKEKIGKFLKVVVLTLLGYVIGFMVVFIFALVLGSFGMHTQ